MATRASRSIIRRTRGLALGLTLGLAGLVLCAPEARAQPQRGNGERRVAIATVTTLGVDQATADSIASRLGEVLAERLQITPQSGAAMRRALGGPISDTCVDDTACIQKAGEKLGADELLLLAIVRIGKSIQISITWADGKTGATEPRERLRIQDPQKERAIFAQAARRLLPYARPRPSPSANGDAARPPGTRVEPSDRSPTDRSPTDRSPTDRSPTDRSPTGAATSGTRPPLGPAGRSGGGPSDVSPGRRLTTGVLIAGGIGLLALGGGTYYGIKALQTDSDLSDLRCDEMCGEENRGKRDELESQINRADVLFAVALVAGGTAGFLYWRSGRGSDNKVDVALTPSGAHISLSGRF